MYYNVTHLPGLPNTFITVLPCYLVYLIHVLQCYPATWFTLYIYHYVTQLPGLPYTFNTMLPSYLVYLIHLLQCYPATWFTLHLSQCVSRSRDR